MKVIVINKCSTTSHMNGIHGFSSVLQQLNGKMMYDRNADKRNCLTFDVGSHLHFPDALSVRAHIQLYP